MPLHQHTQMDLSERQVKAPLRLCWRRMYRPVSIKAGERKKRGESSSLELKIHGGSTQVPKQWAKFISNLKNKKNLAEFLCDALSQHLPSQKVFLAGRFKDGSRTVSLTQGSVAIESNLCSDHEEADTRMLLHAKHATTTHRRIITQSPDTAVAMLSIAYFEDLSCQELFFRTGVKDKQRFELVNGIQHSLGPASVQMSAVLSCTYWLRINKCFVWNREEGLEGVDQEESDTGRSQQTTRRLLLTRPCKENC